MSSSCSCVPSGTCHSWTLLGCPHPHHFDEQGKWTCGTIKATAQCVRSETVFEQTDFPGHVFKHCADGTQKWSQTDRTIRPTLSLDPLLQAEHRDRIGCQCAMGHPMSPLGVCLTGGCCLVDCPLDHTYSSANDGKGVWIRLHK